MHAVVAAVCGTILEAVYVVVYEGIFCVAHGGIFIVIYMGIGGIFCVTCQATFGIVSGEYLLQLLV